VANSHSWGGTVNSTASFVVGDRWVEQRGIGFPSGNVGLNDPADVYVESITADYLSGGSGLFEHVIKGSNTITANEWAGASGGSFNFRIGGTGSGNHYFGRNTGAGGVFYYDDGNTGSGSLPGQFTWSTYPAGPASASISRVGNDMTVAWTAPPDNGGSTITTYGIQYSTDLGATWSSEQTDTTSPRVYNDLPPAQYRFRVYAINARGKGNARVSNTLTIPAAGGKRYTGSAFAAIATAKRYNGSSFVDLTTRKRYNGSAWVDISN
jgi:hypothetical protein